MKDLNKLYEEKTLYYWCNAVGDLNIPGYPLLACPTADKLPPDVREVYEKYWSENGWECRYVVTCDGETGLLLNYLFDHSWIKDMIEEKELKPFSDEDRSKLLHIAVDATVGIVEDYIRSKTEKRFEILVGYDTDPDGDELGVFFPISELENNAFVDTDCEDMPVDKELSEIVYNTVEKNFFRALRGEPASGYDVTLYYGYVDSHDSYDVYHSFELEDPEGTHDENMGAKLAELLDTTAEDEDFRWKSMSVKLPESLVERIQEDAIWGKLRKEQDPVRAYGLYKLWWMIENDHTLDEIAGELQNMRYEDPDDSDRIITLDTALYDEWESEKGFGGEMFPEYAVFLAKWKSGDRK